MQYAFFERCAPPLFPMKLSTMWASQLDHIAATGANTAHLTPLFPAQPTNGSSGLWAAAGRPPLIRPAVPPSSRAG